MLGEHNRVREAVHVPGPPGGDALRIRHPNALRLIHPLVPLPPNSTHTPALLLVGRLEVNFGLNLTRANNPDSMPGSMPRRPPPVPLRWSPALEAQAMARARDLQDGGTAPAAVPPDQREAVPTPHPPLRSPIPSLGSPLRSRCP